MGRNCCKQEQALLSHGVCEQTMCYSAGRGGCTQEVLALPGRATETEVGLLEEETSNPEIQKMSRSHHPTCDIFKVC